MKFLTDLLNRIITHWISTLFGIGYLVLLYLLVIKQITVTEFCIILPAILGIKNILFNKDDNKLVTKPEVKEGEIKPPSQN